MGGILHGATERESCSVRREVEVKEIGQEEVETAMHRMKNARRQGQTKCG